ncbi:sulfotransferase [Chloroflexi bacterium TSY]|nr:sulfotransferase [Chloroflexi bacterium TSY]
MRYLAAVRRQDTACVNAAAIGGGLRHLYPQAAVVGDKHPDYMFQLGKLTEDAALKCIFIYRDPRDLASSVVRAARTIWSSYFREELREAKAVATRWVKSIAMMERYADKLHIIRYEELVLNPQQVLKALGTFLDVDPSQFDHKVLRVDSVGKHRNRLTAQEISSVIDVAGATMKRLGMTI